MTTVFSAILAAVRRRHLSIGTVTLVGLIPSLCFAATVVNLTPTLELDHTSAMRRLSAAKSQSMQVDGNGSTLFLSYSTSVPIDIDVAPIVTGTSFNPSDLAHTTLPAGQDMEAHIDLTQAPSWSPGGSKYYVGFFMSQEDSDAELREIKVLPSSVLGTAGIAFRHLLHGEEFQASTPHGMRGYLVLGVALSTILGIITLIAACIWMWRGRLAVITICVLGMLIYGVRWNIDLLRFSATNLFTWVVDGRYGHLGSGYEIAQELRKEEERGRPPVGVFVCTGTTDFLTKFLRYEIYPIPISIVTEDVQKSSHVLVTNIGDWKYENGMLHCGRIDGKATKVREFADGSVLFTTYNNQ